MKLQIREMIGRLAYGFSVAITALVAAGFGGELFVRIGACVVCIAMLLYAADGYRIERSDK